MGAIRRAVTSLEDTLEEEIEKLAANGGILISIVKRYLLISIVKQYLLISIVKQHLLISIVKQHLLISIV